MINKLLCSLGFHYIGWRCMRTGIFLHSKYCHYDCAQKKMETICWRCREYRIDGEKIRDNFYSKETTKATVHIGVGKKFDEWLNRKT